MTPSPSFCCYLTSRQCCDSVMVRTSDSRSWGWAPGHSPCGQVFMHVPLLSNSIHWHDALWLAENDGSLIAKCITKLTCRPTAKQPRSNCTMCYWAHNKQPMHLLAHETFGSRHEWSQLHIRIFATHLLRHFLKRVKLWSRGIDVVLVNLTKQSITITVNCNQL